MRLIRLFGGLSLFAVGIVITLRANIGYAPWDVFHDGLAKTAGITIGLASILVGIGILIIVALFKEKFGLGTIMNMVLVGVLIDLILAWDIIPLADGFVAGVLSLILGLFIMALASCFYISSGFGAGPRDSLMVVIMRKTKFPAGVCRIIVEVSAVACGWFLGGMAGAGTIITAFGIGLCIQIVFKLLKFDATAVVHETLAQTGRTLIAVKRNPKV